ncbi:MAG: phytanoyl-CoA dioxygenase family protein [Pseudomonadota bacterium]
MLQARTDLGFAPVGNANPARLSADDISRYNSTGYLQPFDIFSPDEIAEIRAYIDDLMHAVGAEGAYGINCYQARLAGLWDIATDRRIVEHVEDIIGPNVICWASAILSKAPHDPKEVPWHQDAGFWALSPARTVTVWLAIDDADESNSAMRFIPGTHRQGVLEVSQAGDGSVFHKQTKNADRLGDPFVNDLKAGQISLHADMLVHGSLPNRSARRRCGLTLRYCPPEVQIIDPAWAKGVEAILCAGEAKGWKTFPRPDNDDISQTSSPHVVGNN